MKDNFEKDINSKLKDFEMRPPAEAWTNISSELGTSHTKNLQLWKYLAALGVAILPIAFVLYSSLNHEDLSSSTIESTKDNLTHTGFGKINPQDTASYPGDYKPSHVVPPAVASHPQQNRGTKESSFEMQTTQKGTSASASANPSEIESSTHLPNESDSRKSLVSTSKKHQSTAENSFAAANLVESKLQHESQINPIERLSVSDKKDVSASKTLGSELPVDADKTEILAFTPTESQTNNYPSFDPLIPPNTTSDNESLIVHNDILLNQRKDLKLERELQSTIGNQPIIAEHKQNENNSDDLKIANKENKWGQTSFSVEPYLGIGLLSSMNGSSLIAGDFNILEIENDNTSMMGAKFGYQINEKLKLRTGLGVINLTQHTYNVPMMLGGMANSRYNIKTDSEFQINMSNHRDGSGIASENINPIYQNMRHDIRYLDVPVELEYEMAQLGNLSFLGSGGLSTMILNQNDIFMSNNEVAARYGAATTLKSVSFSANLGLKSEYQFSRIFTLHLEPQFRYMINTVTANPDAQPFMLGVNTGLRMTF